MSIEQAERSFPFTAEVPWGPSPEFTDLCVSEPAIRVMLPSGDRAWLVSGYDDVRQVFADPRFSRATATGPGAPTFIRPAPGLVRGILSHDSLLGKDAPDHTRLRRLVAKTFTMRHIDRLRPRLQQITDDLLDAMTTPGPPGDLVAGFAEPLSSAALYELLGLPGVDRGRLRRWLDVLRDPGVPDEDADAARAAIEAYAAQLIAGKRAAPAGDLLSDLIAARDEQGRLSENELTTMLMFLLFAGQAGTAIQIPRFVLLLLRHPEQLRLLREHPEQISTAVEELLRYTPFGIGSGFPRVATQDVEVAGVLIHAGEAVIPHSMSANRDPSVFDEPDRLDLARTSNPHVTFGHGIHHCLGAPLARAETQIALNTLVRRLLRLRLAVREAELDWQFASRALPRLRAFPRLRALPVIW